MKKILLFLAIFCTLFGAVMAQEDATIDPNKIEYWVGEGENEAIFIVQWCEPEIAFAWGYRFDGEVVVEAMMDDIAAADSRFIYEGDASTVNQIYYQDDDYNLTLTGWGWMYNLNGWMAGLGYTEQTVTDGDVVKWGDAGCGHRERLAGTGDTEKRLKLSSRPKTRNEVADRLRLVAGRLIRGMQYKMIHH